MSRNVSVSVPASSANVGPGFDAFGLALALRNTFVATAAEEWSVDIAGEGERTLPRGPENPVARAAARVFDEAGIRGGAHIQCENHIPPGEGLGSSAAAVVGGLLIGDALAGAGMSDDDILALATEIEGHPDNAAAALHGGFTVCWDDGAPRSLRIEPGCGIALVLVRATHSFATEESRLLLPAEVLHADAAFNAGRAGLLVAAVSLGDERALAAGLTDRIHEPYRRIAMPDIELVRSALLDAGATGAVLSGAGPAMIGFVCAADREAAHARAEQVAEAAMPAISHLPHRQPPLVLGIDLTGATVERT